jgi:hypothetical protein
MPDFCFAIALAFAMRSYTGYLWSTTKGGI